MRSFSFICILYQHSACLAIRGSPRIQGTSLFAQVQDSEIKTKIYIAPLIPRSLQCISALFANRLHSETTQIPSISVMTPEGLSKLTFIESRFQVPVLLIDVFGVPTHTKFSHFTLQTETNKKHTLMQRKSTVHAQLLQRPRQSQQRTHHICSTRTNVTTTMQIGLSTNSGNNGESDKSTGRAYTVTKPSQLGLKRVPG